jgi:hypothetical protein
VCVYACVWRGGEGGGNPNPAAHRPYVLHRSASRTLFKLEKIVNAEVCFVRVKVCFVRVKVCFVRVSAPVRHGAPFSPPHPHPHPRCPVPSGGLQWKPMPQLRIFGLLRHHLKLLRYSHCSLPVSKPTSLPCTGDSSSTHTVSPSVPLSSSSSSSHRDITSAEVTSPLSCNHHLSSLQITARAPQGSAPCLTRAIAGWANALRPLGALGAAAPRPAGERARIRRETVASLWQRQGARALAACTSTLQRRRVIVTVMVGWGGVG